MATLKKERFGNRHTERIIATDGDNGPRGVFNMSYRAGDRSKADTLVRLEFRVTDGPRSHQLHTLELSGQELVEIVRCIASSTLQADHESAFLVTDALRRIFNRC